MNATTNTKENLVWLRKNDSKEKIDLKEKYLILKEGKSIFYTFKR